MENLKLASLFSGCGGMDLGAKGGFEFLGKEYSNHPTKLVFAIDSDEYACQIFDKNFNVKCTNKDIRKIKNSEIPKHNILIGGFPCQSFSIVAQNPPRLGYDDENGRLVFEMCRILKKSRPVCFIAENVKGILSANNGLAFQLILEAFEKSHYYVKHATLDASDYGIPQKRERVFIVGFKDKRMLKKFSFPTPTTKITKVPLSKVLLPEKKIDKKYYFSKKAVNGMLKVRSKMNKGREQNLNEPCNTVGAHLAKVSLNSTDPVLKRNGRYRRFTPGEAALIQSFPENFIFVGSEGRQYKAIGNAVPPVLMWHVMNEVIRTINSD